MATKMPFTQQVFSLAQSFALVKAALESSNDGVLVVTKEGIVVDYNHRFANMWHIPKKVMESRDEKSIFDFIYSQLLDSENFSIDLQKEKLKIFRCKDGRVFECYCHQQAEEVGYVWIFHNVTKYKKLEEEVQYQASHDLLTGLPNRILLLDRLRQAIVVANRDQFPFALAVFDLDRFKMINDSLTHAVGDEVLRIVAKRLLYAMRDGDTLARLDSDKFVFIITSLTHKDQVVMIVQELLSVLNHPIKIANREITLTATAGVCLYPEDGDTADILLRNADTTVYRAKKYGANRFEFYATEMNGQSLARLDQEMQLRQAIANEEFILHYQPQFDVLSGKLVGVEALLRWQHPEKGLIMPGDFISLAEETGLIVPVGEWVLRTACKQARQWQVLGFPSLRIGVNVALQQFTQQNLVTTVASVLNETGLQPKYLELEITENVIINTLDVIEIISTLKEMGVKITLDDFGTGYSSLSYLKKIPLNRLKIDRSFIQNAPVNRDDNALVSAIIGICNAFGLEVLAEGVETSEQLAFLQAEKCHEVQGFYFSKPLSVNDFHQYISSM